MWAWLVFMAIDAQRIRANRFAAVTIRLQEERGQTVVSTGPYAIVRHPMYAYALLLTVGIPLLLGSLWVSSVWSY
jgi:protein-S-isoprenylcysteine O-methyltransferase Ste14